MPEPGLIKSGEELRVNLGVTLNLPPNHFAQLHLRSSVAEEYPDLKLLGGIIGENTSLLSEACS